MGRKRKRIKLKDFLKSKKQRQEEQNLSSVRKALKAGQISADEYAVQKTEIKGDIRKEQAKKNKLGRIVGAAAIGAATGGLGGLALGGLGGGRAKNWGQVALAGGAGGLVGGGIQRGIFGSGGGLGGSAYSSLFGGGGATGAGAAKGAGGGIKGWLGKLATGKGLLKSLGGLAGLYGAGRGTQEALEEAKEPLTDEERATEGSMQDLRGKLLGNLADSADEGKFGEELYASQEPRYAASMFKRGLQGSSAYGVGLADLLKTSDIKGQQLRSGQQAGQLAQLNYLGGELGGYGDIRRQGRQDYIGGLQDLGYTGASLYNLGRN